MMKRYLVLAMRRPDFDGSIVSAHLDFLEKGRLAGQVELAGPFGDKTGGAYLLRAASLSEAEAIAFADPLHTSGNSEITVKEWTAK